ncbi:MAG: hypothetical protein NT070_06875 [Cyanobacteria bacterium]|nr:hypothetical protein [Cyanobacteriota bacterium]
MNTAHRLWTHRYPRLAHKLLINLRGVSGHWLRGRGDRLGKANTLQAIGDLEKDPKNGLKQFDQAMQIYQEVGDQYSQARILRDFFRTCLYQTLYQTRSILPSKRSL